MDITVTALVAVGVVVAWLGVAGLVALLAGRMIHERDVHDRPAAPRLLRPAPAVRGAR